MIPEGLLLQGLLGLFSLLSKYLRSQNECCPVYQPECQDLMLPAIFPCPSPYYSASSSFLPAIHPPRFPRRGNPISILAVSRLFPHSNILAEFSTDTQKTNCWPQSSLSNSSPYFKLLRAEGACDREQGQWPDRKSCIKRGTAIVLKINYKLS